MSSDCQEILNDLALYLDGECDADVEHVIAKHLNDCPPCMDRSDFERQLKALLARSCRDRVPQAVLERVQRRFVELT